MLDKQQLDQLYRFAISLTHNDDQAYDILQTCLEKYLRAGLKDIEKPIAYLKRMIRNEFIDQIRKRRLYQEVDAETMDRISDQRSLDQPTIEDVFVKQSEVAALLGTMQPEEREILYLWAVEEYTIEEIARIKEVPRGTLLSKLHRLKKRVQLQLASDNVLNLRVKL